jgi:hypothetical protein
VSFSVGLKPFFFIIMSFSSWSNPKITVPLICRIVTISKGKKESSCWSKLEASELGCQDGVSFPFGPEASWDLGQVTAPQQARGWWWGQPLVTWDFGFLILEQRSSQVFGRIVGRLGEIVRGFENCEVLHKCQLLVYTHCQLLKGRDVAFCFLLQFP